MNKLLKSLTKVIKFLEKKGVKFTLQTEDDMCADGVEYHDVGEHEICIEDDMCKQTWATEVKVPDMSHEDLSKLLVEVLGPQTKIHKMTDGEVDNWEPSKNHIVVHRGDSIDFIQYYTKK